MYFDEGRRKLLRESILLGVAGAAALPVPGEALPQEAKKQKENIRSFKNHIKSMVKFFVSNTYYNRFNIYFKHELRNIQNMLKFNFLKLDDSKNVKQINFIKYKLKNIKDKHFERTFINIKRKVIQIYLYKRKFKLIKKIKNILSYTFKKRFTSHK